MEGGLEAVQLPWDYLLPSQFASTALPGEGDGGGGCDHHINTSQITPQYSSPI